MTALTVTAMNKSLSGMLLAKKGDCVVWPVCFEQVRILAAQRAKCLREEPRELFARYRADAQVTGDIAIGPIPQPRTPETRLHVFDDDAYLRHPVEQHTEGT